MKKLYLHIGLGKTGSSALQSWLSLNAKLLSRQGIDYADLAPQAKSGKISSGNGHELLKACKRKDFIEVERLLTKVYFFRRKNSTAIVSSEVLQGLAEPSIQKIKDICAKNNIEVTVIAYVRSIYEQSYSTYLQRLKRSNATHSFGEIKTDYDFSKSVEFLKRYFSRFGDRLLLINYDAVKDDIYTSFAGIVGFDIKNTKEFSLKVNRSLTREEAEVLRQMNKLHDGAFSTQISDFVIASAPNIKTEVFYDPQIVEKVRKDTVTSIEWINEQFQLTPPLVPDFYTGSESSHPIVLTKASYQGVVRWALDYKPRKAVHGKFVSFLRDFAVFLEKTSMDHSFALIARADKLGPGKASMDKKMEDNEEVREKILRRAQYLISYCSSEKSTARDEPKEQLSKFKDWLSSLSGSVVRSPYTRVNTTAVNPDGSIVDGVKPSMTGFIIIEADSLEAALSIAKKSPYIEGGWSVEVSELVQIFKKYQS